MRYVLLCLVLVGCDPGRALEVPVEAEAADPAPTCGVVGKPCCYAKTGCIADPRGGADCISPPDETSQGVCVKYGTCGNPGNVACDVDGVLMCEYNYGADADGVCRFLDL